MMDLGYMWRDAVDCVKERMDEPVVANNKDRILRNEEHVLSRQCGQIVKAIGDLKRFLRDNRGGYLASNTGISGVGGSAVSDFEREQIDTSADEISINCHGLISKFRKNLTTAKMSGSRKEHFELVSDGLETYLKSVISIHSEMRAVRLQKQLQLTHLSKLEVNSKESRKHEIPKTSSPRLTETELQEKAVSAAASLKSSQWDSSDEEDELSPEESQQLEMENEKLYEQLTSLQNSVDQVTTKVVKISELQEIFSEKVLQQSAEIEAVHMQTVNTTENIKGGNEAVRQAIQNKASYRVIILFILIVFSFSLLFLDWYND